MNNFPLHQFIVSLAADEIILSVRDYDRLLLAFQTSAPWTLSRLKNVITALLSRNEDQQDLIERKFDRFFKVETEWERQLPEIEIRRALNDLRKNDSKPLLYETEAAGITNSPHISQNKRSHRHYKGLYGPWIYVVVILQLISIIAFTVIKINPPSLKENDKPIEVIKPALDLNPSLLDFGSSEIGKTIGDSFVVTNRGKDSLEIKEMVSGGKSPNSFELSVPDLPLTLAPGEELPVSVFFKPPSEGTWFGEVEIYHNLGNGVDRVAFKGVGVEKVPLAERTRLYRNIPHVIYDPEYAPIERPEEWKRYMVISAVLLLLLILFAFYLRYLRKGPKNLKPIWDKNGPMYFHPSSIGGKPEPWLDDETLGVLADSMGYFKSEQPGRVLNVPASIEATVSEGGVPTCRFYSSSRIRTLLILEDEDAESLEINPLSRELAKGMERYGVPVIYGRFRGSPEIFRTGEGQVRHLEDLEDQRRGVLVLLFTDGKGFYGPQNIFALEAISRWPMLAWMELGERDDSSRVAIDNKIPLYPATRDGIVRAVRIFLTEQGKSASNLHDPVEELPFSSQFINLSDRSMPKEFLIEQHLGEALPWAQECAMFQPVPIGLADALRREFHHKLPPERIERLFRLPNTTKTEAGLRFSDETLKILRRGFLDTRSDDEQLKVMEFILKEVEKARPDLSEHSLAYLAWESLVERVRLEVRKDNDDDLKRFGELLNSPMGKNLGDSLEGFDYSNKDKVPLRGRIRNRKAQLRLKQVEGNPVAMKDPLSLHHWAVTGVLVLSFIISTVVTVNSIRQAYGPIPNLEIIASEPVIGQLSKLVNDKWVDQSEFEEVHTFTQSPLLEGHDYRLYLYGHGDYSVKEFRVKKDHITVLTLGNMDKEAPCRRRYADLDLTVISCSDTDPGYGNRPFDLAGWKERLGGRAPKDRVMSIGIEIYGLNDDEPGLKRFRDILLDTGSVDLLYQIDVDKENKWQMEGALQKIRQEIGPWISKSQLLWWEAGRTPELSWEMVIDFQRAIRTGKGEDLSWVAEMEGIFTPGSDLLVKEDEVKQVVKTEVQGKGAPIALIREQKFSATLWKSLEGTSSSSVAFYSPTGNYFAVLNDSKNIILYDRSFKEIGTIDGLDHMQSLWGNRLAFSPDEKYVAFSGKQEGREVIVAEIPRLEIVQRITDHSKEVLSVHFSPDGTLLATGSRDKTVKILRFSSGQFVELQTLKGHTDEIYSVSFSPDGKFLSSGSRDNIVKIWKFSSGRFIELQTLKDHRWRVFSVSFSPNGKFLASGSWDKTVKIWKFSAGQFIELQTLKGHKDLVSSVSFSPDGKFLASGSWDDAVKIWKFSSGRFIEVQTLKDHKANVYSVSFSPNGKYLMTSGYNGVIIWKLTGVGAAKR